MSITDELRKYAGEAVKRPDYMAGLTFDLERIADRIDAEHYKAVEELKAKCGDMWLKGYAECRVELMGGNEVIAASLEEAGWVKLPVDADGETIHIGDEMVLQHEVTEKPYTVQSLTWDGEDWYFTCDEGFFNACGWMHHHAPTVEDVLREFSCALMGKREFDGDVAEAISEYASKLRLAGDAE